ncbi:MAG: tetratricopeptide repeat protein, partial [Aureliella sp.]
HTMTCGPATLSAISRYWNRPAEHLEVAEEICYNGTSHHAEREWANHNGYATREFTVDESATESLIGRDVPFTLVTRGAGFAHLQAVIGYDGRTGSILVRDPSHRVRGTMGADELFESQAAHGPRGMVLVPLDKAQLIDDLPLLDSELYDLMHQLDGALIKHRRDEAIELLERLAEQAPQHRLRWQADRQLAIYDGDEQRILNAVQKLLDLYSDDVQLQMSELSLLRNLGRTHELIERLREHVDKPLPHPLFRLQLAELLVLDGRYRDEAHDQLRAAIRTGSSHARCYLELADLLWLRQDRPRALRLYRIAACLEDKDEYLAFRYFDALSVLGRTEEAIDWLTNRFERFGKQSMQPAVTLHHALTRLRRHAQGIEVLEQAMKLRPDDSELTLLVVESLASTSSDYWPRADALLHSVRGSAPERNWKEAASHLAVVQGDWAKGLEHLQDLLPRSPLSMGLRERIAELLLAVEGEEAALEFWRSAAEQFPHYQPLIERHAISMRSRPLEEIEPVLNHILELNPDNAWAVRELAQHLLSAGKLVQAEVAIAHCVKLDAENSTTKLLQASLDSRRGNNASARARLRKMLTSDISDEHAVSQLIGYCETLEQRTETLHWILSELRRQPISGGVMMVYRDYAEAVLSEDTILEAMQEAVKLRGELWTAHQALIRQLTQMQRLGEALHEAENATTLFSLEPNAWYELFQVATAMGDPARQRLALEKCRLLRPNNATVTRSLSDLLCSEGKYCDARDLLQSLVAAQPLDAVNRGYLADVLLELGEKETALSEFATACSLQPDYDFAWSRFDDLAADLERPDARLDLTQRLTQEKAHSAGAWLQHARGLVFHERFDEAHQAIDRAEALDPYRESVHSLRAQTLANSGNFEAALAALQPAVFPTIPPALDLHRAQLLWDIGAQAEAYELLQESVEQNPDVVNLWRRLEQWATARDDRATAIRAVEHQIKLQPHNPDVLDAAGDAFTGLESKPQAIEAFRHAVEVAPTFAGSRCKLFDLLVEQDEWEEASQVIRDLPRVDQHPTVIARRLQVSLHQNDLEQADADLVGVFASDDWTLWAAERATELMREAKLTDRLLDLIEQRLSDKSFNENSARMWVSINMNETEVAVKQRISTVTQRIDRWMAGEHPAAGRSAISMLIHIFSTRNLANQLQRFVSNNKQTLCDDLNNWSVVTFAYADNPSLFKNSTLREWLRGWEDRDDYDPWMFANIHELCRIVGDHAGGRRAVQRALALPPDHMQSQFRLWAAHDALVDRDSRLALRHFMSAARLEHLNGHERLMHHCIEAVLHMQQSPDKAATFKAVRKQLDDLRLTAKFFTEQPVYRPVYENTVRSIAQAANSHSARWWKLKKLAPLKLRAVLPGWLS